MSSCRHRRLPQGRGPFCAERLVSPKNGPGISAEATQVWVLGNTTGLPQMRGGPVASPDDPQQSVFSAIPYFCETNASRIRTSVHKTNGVRHPRVLRRNR
jgi:hypothetical protein